MSEIKNKEIHFRCTEQQREKIKTIANKLDVNISELMIMLTESSIIQLQILEDVQLTQTIIQKMTDFYNEMNVIGRNINQATKGVNELKKMKYYYSNDSLVQTLDGIVSTLEVGSSNLGMLQTSVQKFFDHLQKDNPDLLKGRKSMTIKLEDLHMNEVTERYNKKSEIKNQEVNKGILLDPTQVKKIREKLGYDQIESKPNKEIIQNDLSDIYVNDEQFKNDPVYQGIIHNPENHIIGFGDEDGERVIFYNRHGQTFCYNGKEEKSTIVF